MRNVLPPPVAFDSHNDTLPAALDHPHGIDGPYHQHPSASPRLQVPPPPLIKHDSIKIEYDPNSGLPPQIFEFEEFTRCRPTTNEPEPDPEPHRLFLTPMDFRFASFTLTALLSDELVDNRIDMIHCVVSGQDELTFKSHVQARQTHCPHLQYASLLLPCISPMPRMLPLLWEKDVVRPRVGEGKHAQGVRRRLRAMARQPALQRLSTTVDCS
ncbi:hypothetical protein OH77DRAFT_1518069 [Trametes cingulata]|nr:hypothetical protein OH77DRAFT_1518069 [Trametes cingulata]